MAQIASTAADAVASLQDRLGSMAAEAAASSDSPPSAEDQLASREAGKQVQASIQRIIDHLHENAAKNSVTEDPSPRKVYARSLATSRDPKRAAKHLKEATENKLVDLNDAGSLMANSIDTILQSFDDTLKLPDLDKFSGVLETVPIIGIQDNNVMYAAKVLDQQKIKLEWKILGRLPPGAVTGATTRLFAYNGKLYLALGRKLYYKAVKDKNSPDVLLAATDDWAKIFVDSWFTSQDQAPWQDNFQSLVTWSGLSSDGQAVDTYLVQIAHDYTWSYHSGTIVDGQPITFVNMSFAATKAYPNMPLLKKAAYNTDNSIWGYDASNKLWKIKPDFAANTWSVQSAEQFDGNIVDMTAIDIGIAVAKDNGELRVRTFEPPEDPSSSDPKKNTVQINWKAYDLSVKDKTALGSASLPMVLDTLTLTTYLRSKYISTQVGLLPTMRKIILFAKSHQLYMTDMIKAATKMEAVESQAEKDAIANTAGKAAMAHAKLYGHLIFTSVSSSQNTVIDMTREIKDIGKSLDVQLQGIATSLVSLNATLKEKQAEFDAFTIGMWASIATAVVGIGVLIGAACLAATGFGAPIAIGLAVLGGAMVVGGIVGVAVTASKRSQAASAVASTETAITAQTTRQTKLTNIKTKFSEIDKDYGNLNAFWGLMKTDADNADLESLQVGLEILSDKYTLQAAKDSSASIEKNFKTYIATLSAQGIKEPDESFLAFNTFASDWHDHDVETIRTNLYSASAGLPSVARHHANHHVVEGLMSAANEKLAGGDWSSYFSMLNKATVMHSLIL